MTCGSAVGVAVVGTLDEAYRVERISRAAEDLFELPVSEIVGTSLFELLVFDHAPTCLAALVSALQSQSGVNVQLAFHAGAKETVQVQAAFHALQPTPGCAFIFLPCARS
jgi:nitrogen fixation/metabolism regulation signal transduction histidine kinase